MGCIVLYYVICYLLFVIQYYNANARMVVIENLNVLMAALILSYASSIGIIWKIYKNQKENSMSEILNKNKWRVMGSAIMMGMITCLCEHQRIQHVPPPEDVHWHQYGFACHQYGTPNVCNRGIYCHCRIHVCAPCAESNPYMRGNICNPVCIMR